MFLSEVKKYRKDNIVYVGGEVPEGAEVLETMDILNAEEGYDLIRKSDGGNVGSSIWLKDGDTEENYIEVKNDDSNIMA
jgi:hypothetical protein